MEVYLAVHILAAVLWAGGGAALHVLGRRAMRSREPGRLVEAVRDIHRFGPRLYAPLALVLLLFGILLVGEVQGFEQSQLWITLGYLGWLAAFLIAFLFYGSQERTFEALVAERGPDHPDVRAAARRTLLLNSVEVAILLLVVVDMAVKPGL